MIRGTDEKSVGQNQGKKGDAQKQAFGATEQVKPYLALPKKIQTWQEKRDGDRSPLQLVVSQQEGKACNVWIVGSDPKNKGKSNRKMGKTIN